MHRVLPSVGSKVKNAVVRDCDCPKRLCALLQDCTLHATSHATRVADLGVCLDNDSNSRFRKDVTIP